MVAPLMFAFLQLRRRWRGWLVLGLLLGLFAGAVEAAAAGAYRTDSAYPRLLAWSNAPDGMVLSPPVASRTFASAQPRQLARLPQVIAAGVAMLYTVAEPSAIGLVAPEDGRIPGQLWFRKLLAGRLPDPAAPDEANVSFTVAQQFKVGVGDTLPLSLLTVSGPPRTVRLRIVGIEAAAAEFPPGTGTGTDTVWATPAFYRQHRGQPLDDWEASVLRLRHGVADWPSVQRAVERLAHGRVLQGFTMADTSAATERSIHLQAVALWLLAALLALIGLLVAGQLISRLTLLEADDYETAKALGMTRRQLVASAIGRALVLGIAAALAATILAVATSPLFPIGLARLAEPRPGIDVDGTVLALGFCATLAGVVACSVWPAWRSARGQAGLPAARRSTGLISALAAGLRPVSAATGLRLALQRGSGRTALPVLTTVATAAVGLAALTAALVFSESLDHLLSTPRLYGASWDVLVQSTGTDEGQGVTPAVPVVARDAAVAAWSDGYAGVPLRLGSGQVQAIALNPGRGGPLQPTLVRGRLPGPGEIALGVRTLANLHAHVGDTLRVALTGPQQQTVRVVGVVILPTLGDQLTLGTGASLTVDELKHLAPPTMGVPAYDTLVVRLRPGADQQAAVARLSAELAPRGAFAVSRFQTPNDLLNFGGVRAMPTLLGILLAILALATITHLLITSVRRRRRDLAVLRTIGFTRPQVRAAVAWQAVTLTVVALAIGMPLGVIGGRYAWLTFTRQIGVLPVLHVQPLAFTEFVLLALVLALAVSAPPGEAAARSTTARILRSE